METERVEASLRGWPQAPYKTKRETDANFRRTLQEMMQPENLAAMDVGVASHNLFDLAYGLVLAVEQNALDKMQLEMLEGMANHQRRALLEVCSNLLLYAPACDKKNFINAIGYLVRRLDENTGPENFLRHAFRLYVGSPEWQRLESGFLAAFDTVATVGDAPRRTQDRRRPPPDSSLTVARGWLNLWNEPDTDFSLPQNDEWAANIMAKSKPLCDARAPQIPLMVAGEEVLDGRICRDCLDPSRPGVIVGRCRQAGEADVLRAVECAAGDPDGWRTMPTRERFAILGDVSQEIRKARADLMGAALANGGKTLAESDPEVSEAVDFLEFYRDTARWWQEMPSIRTRPKGVVVVVSPWNFPIAIPCGGVAAALAAGNTVILKPASDAVLEEWALMPQNLEGNPNLWSPGIKYGVRPVGYTHTTEFFGPVLGVMRFTKLAEAVALVNQTGYGLTSGLESLDDREWEYWKEHVRAGNLYINRVTTGAVVLRQPFGGFGKSVFGPGMKAGGPNYVMQFMDFSDAVPAQCAGIPSKPCLADPCDRLRSRTGELGENGDQQFARICAAILSYEQACRDEFGISHDHFRLIGQDNFRRYLPVADVRVRVHPQDTAFDLFARACATHIAGSRVTVSSPPQFASSGLKLLEELTESWAGAIEFVEESDEQLAQAIRERQTDRIRYAATERVPLLVLQAAGETGLCVVSSPVLAEGRVELLWYLHEQSISSDYHRYGNLGARVGEPRSEPL